MLTEQYLDLQAYEPTPEDIQEMREIEEQEAYQYQIEELWEKEHGDPSVQLQLQETREAMNHAKQIVEKWDELDSEALF